MATTMTVNSTAPATTHASNVPSPEGRRWLAVNGGILVAGFLLIGSLPRRRDRARLATFLLAVALVGSMVACGGGGSTGGGGGGQQIPGTTAGAYTFTVSGAFTSGGVAQAQAAATVTIQ